MKISKMKSMFMTFKEKQYDENGNVMHDSNGNPIIKHVKRVVHHNPAYRPSK